MRTRISIYFIPFIVVVVILSKLLLFSMRNEFKAVQHNVFIKLKRSLDKIAYEKKNGFHLTTNH